MFIFCLFPAADCQYEFLSSLRKNGTFTSPHYPNPYPESKRCHYIFQGQGKERVQIAFNDLDLNYDAMSNPGQRSVKLIDVYGMIYYKGLQ